MDLEFERRQLRKAEIDLIKAEWRIERQEGVIRGLEEDGQATDDAQKVLDQFNKTREVIAIHRNRISEVIEVIENTKKKKSSIWKGLDAVLRHPTTLLILGFVLTAIVGGQLQSRQQEIEKDRTQTLAGHEAIQKIRQALAEYAMRGQLLWIQRDGPVDEKGAMLSRMDEAFVTLTKTIYAESPIVLRAINGGKPTLSDIKINNYFVDLRDFLVDSNERVFEIAKMPRPHLTNPSGEGWRYIENPMKYFMEKSQYCIDLFLVPFESALDVSDAQKRMRWVFDTMNMAGGIYRKPQFLSEGLICPLYRYKNDPLKNK
ncbi:hypothetical protein AWB67_05622 [Caballeronia terrestris]|uniref:Uncharacterized protein n=1 Tax=Caballeronia terrestris TaxID=1226301 RepID=A0A158KH14_9BURK|nr:hypothetical protein [Caballeronia terrestris]SAL80432.1 hypothetical protein AWB67_05622 [Caballeronia terrestris]